MENITTETPIDNRLPWSRPEVRRLNIAMDTKAGGVSTADGDGTFGEQVVDFL